MACRHRYLFCLKPPALVARRIGVLRDKLAPGGRAIATPHLHVTLARTADYPHPMPEIAAAMDAMGALVDTGPFYLSFDRVSGAEWGAGLRLTRVPPAVRDLHRQLARRLDARGLRHGSEAFSPHITLFFGGGRPFLKSVQPYAWEVDEFLLVHSVVDERRHVGLGRWPLARRQLSLAL